MSRIIVLTHEEDSHADSVCRFFKGKEIEYFRVNTDKLIGNYKVTFDSANGLYTLVDCQNEIVLDDSWNIWNRRIMDP